MTDEIELANNHRVTLSMQSNCATPKMLRNINCLKQDKNVFPELLLKQKMIHTVTFMKKTNNMPSIMQTLTIKQQLKNASFNKQTVP